METLRDMIADYADEKLFEMYEQRGEYTDDAVKIIAGELARRGLDVAAVENASETRENIEEVAAVAPVNREDFAPLTHAFSKADAVIANSILLDGNVPFFMERCDDEKTICCAPVYKDAYTNASVPSSDVTVPKFAVFVYKDAVDKALELIGEHFEAGDDGCYALRSAGVVERLKAFSLYDIKISEKAAEEKLDVKFENQEKNALIKLAELLMAETDQIEEERNRVVFFYDGLETLINNLKKNRGVTRVDFLAIIEMCQIYCEDPRYDPVLNHVAESILEFFMG